MCYTSNNIFMENNIIMSSVKVQERRLTGEIVTRSISTTGKNDTLMKLSVIATTQAPVKRFDFERGEEFFEVLDVKETSVNTTRLKKGIPVLDSHQRGTLSNVLGKTTGFEFKDGQLLLDVKISGKAELEDLRQDIKDGIISDVSIGYVINKFKDEGPPSDDENGLKTLRATDWEVFELSFVAVPADADANIKDARQYTIPLTTTIKEHQDMPDNKIDNTKGVDIDALVKDKVEIEKTKLKAEHAIEMQKHKEVADKLKIRNVEIRDNVKLLNLDEKFANDLIESDVNINRVRQLIIEEASKKEANSMVASLPSDHNERDNYMKGMEEAISLKVRQDQVKGFNVDKDMSDNAKRFFNHENGFFDNLIRGHMINVEGIDASSVRSLNKTVVVNHMLGTRAFGGITPSDLPFTLSNIMDKVLRQLYTLTPKTYLEIVKATTLNNFKIHPRIQNEPATGLQILSESLTPVGGASRRGTIRESQETIQLQTYTRDLFITRQALIDDDLGAFSRIPAVAAQDIILTESALVYGAINGNRALGSDSTALFHANHGNLNLTNPLSGDSAVNTAKKAMRQQVNLAGTPIMNEPNILLIPYELELDALKFVTLTTQLTRANDIAAAVQSINLTLIQTPFLSASQGGSDSTWYLVNNAQPDMLIELATLDNKSGINASFFAEVIIGEGIRYKVLHDAAVSVMDFRPYSQNTA